MQTLRNTLTAAATRLGQRHEAELLLLHVLARNSAWLFAHADDPLAPQHAATFAALLERRAGGEPLAYIIGCCGFWSMDLEISPATLIPRPETECLVELALQRLAPDGPARVADLGTGSGAVALAIARERPQVTVLATDASEQALAVARRNAERLGLPNAAFACGDWCAALGGAHFDMIVSNPPYVALGDEHLAQGDLRYEPPAALASGDDGLDAIRCIVRDAPAQLVAGGWLLLEHGWNQAAAVRKLLHDAGYDDVFSAQDLEHRDRISGARKGS